MKNRKILLLFFSVFCTFVCITANRDVIVGDNAADLYLDQREGNTNTLIWSDEEKSAIFVISAHCSSDELIKIAESVEAVQ